MTKYSRNVVLCILIGFLNLSTYAQRAQEGILDARTIDLNTQRISLTGEWLWADGKLIGPDDPDLKQSIPVEFPKLWNDVRNEGIGQGVATYSLTILLPSDTQELALEIPQIYSSYILWANGKSVAHNGVVGSTEETTVPQWLPQTVVVAAGNSLKLILQISNFHHNKGGCKEPIILGSKDSILSKEAVSQVNKISECVVLLLLSLVFKIVYAWKEKKKVIIYFSLLCTTWAVRSAFSNEYLAIFFFPNFDWASMVRIEYVTLYLTMIWSVLFLSRLFPNESNQIVKYILVILNIGFILFTVLNPPLFFTKLLALYLVTAGILLVYAVLVIVRAYINERTGALFLTLTLLLGTLTFGYDIFTYEGIFVFRSILLSAAYLVMFSMLGVALLLHLNVIKASKPSSNTLTYQDLYGGEKN